MARKHSSINLLRNKDTDFFANFVKWTLSIGRIVIIIVEIIAIMALLYRFSLDRKLVSLRDEIKQKQAILKAQKDNEDLYRQLHDRIDLAKRATAHADERLSIITDILNFTPISMKLNNIVYSREAISIDSNINSVKDLVQFTNSLKEHPSTESVSINRIENRGEINTISAVITIDLKESENSLIDNSNKSQKDPSQGESVL